MGVEGVTGAVWADDKGAAEDVVAGWLADLNDDDALVGLSPGARLASEIVRLRTYAKIRPDGQRETWRQTVTRWGSYMLHRLRAQTGDVGAADELRRAVRAVFAREVMPSMRGLWAAGDVLDHNDIALYNCAFAPADSLAVFHECLYVLMHGTGFGFSVERRFIDKLPIPKAPNGLPPSVHVVEDSTEGWMDAVRVGVTAWYAGDDVVFDASGVRRAGSVLKTKGGEASGPEPLLRYLDGLRTAIQRAGREGRRLRPVEGHDLLCLGARAVQVGGVRRSAMISFSDVDDSRGDNAMRWAKHYPAAMGLGVAIPAERGQANDSWVWPDGLTRESFDYEWQVLQTSKAGERGIFSPARMAYRGVELRANPCVEIGLAWQDAAAPDDGSGGGQFCNLSNVILRPWDDLDSARRKVALAAFIGTLQASCTRFRGLRAGWGEVTRRDALLGVGLSGQADCPQVVSSVAKLQDLNRLAVDANAWWAGVLGINVAAGVTCGKPDGNSSVFLGCSSGIHAHHARRYLRRITVSAKSPICAVLRAAGVPCIPEWESDALALAAGTKSPEAVGGWLFELPMEVGASALVRAGETALGLLDRLDVINTGWLAEKGHNQSVTVSVRAHEWDGVRERVWERGSAGRLGGVSFLPDDGAVYYGMPLTTLEDGEYAARVAALPDVDWSALALYENGVSEAAQTFACTSGACSIV
jgi:ribonucleoside-diphosphate reductase alpha chain